LEGLRLDTEILEEQVLGGSQEALKHIQELRRRTIHVEAQLRQQRKAVNQIVQEPSNLISEPVRFYFRDIHDHAGEQVEMIQAQRESLLSLRDLHLALSNQRLNEVMRVLTVLTSIFMPLSFLTGIYGMNFTESP